MEAVLVTLAAAIQCSILGTQGQELDEQLVKGWQVRKPPLAVLVSFCTRAEDFPRRSSIRADTLFFERDALSARLGRHGSVVSPDESRLLSMPGSALADAPVLGTGAAAA